MYVEPQIYYNPIARAFLSILQLMVAVFKIRTM